MEFTNEPAEVALSLPLPVRVVIQSLIEAGMKQPSVVMPVGKTGIAFDIDGHDFYLKGDRKGGFRFHVHGERKSRCKLGPNFEGLSDVVGHIARAMKEAYDA